MNRSVIPGTSLLIRANSLIYIEHALESD